MPLNDREIRPSLINYLNNAHMKPIGVIQELPICFGNAIADVVSINNKTLHCYEIKGETDSISRIQHQALYYNQSFRKITLVTTTNHINYALNSIPECWGIILVEYKNNNSVSFKNLRKASNNPVFSKEKALQTLWKDELLSIAEKENIKVSTKMNKNSISSVVSSLLSTDYIGRYISSIISSRAKM